MINKILNRNKILFWLGVIHFILFLLLLMYFPFNNTLVLGINSVIKPMKFALSIGVFSWTMALILDYLDNARKVKIYSWAAVVALGFEQWAITSQAGRGELSHFNKNTPYDGILYSLMGIFIVCITLWTAYMTYLFMKQKTCNLPPAMVLSIKIGLIYCVIFSLFGGYISGLEGHTVGGTDDGKGLFFINWNTAFGDLRVAHFFGIHSLQIVPLFGLLMGRFLNNSDSIKAIYLFSIVYLFFILFTMIQALKGMPFMAI